MTMISVISIQIFLYSIKVAKLRNCRQCFAQSALVFFTLAVYVEKNVVKLRSHKIINNKAKNEENHET